ncbi:hypothetical protein VPHD479_0117 [Vibrio phage D479]
MSLPQGNPAYDLAIDCGLGGVKYWDYTEKAQQQMLFVFSENVYNNIRKLLQID